MLIISHRGNLIGSNKELENRPDVIQSVIDNEGFSVEIDLRMKNNELYLGHDEPQYKIDYEFLEKNKSDLWIHCKDNDAFAFCISKNLHYFWHDRDDYTLTSFGYVWAYPGKENVGNLTIAVMPEKKWTPTQVKYNKFFGICTDFPIAYQEIINS